MSNGPQPCKKCGHDRASHFDGKDNCLCRFCDCVMYLQHDDRPTLPPARSVIGILSALLLACAAPVVSEPLDAPADEPIVWPTPAAWDAAPYGSWDVYTSPLNGYDDQPGADFGAASGCPHPPCPQPVRQ